MLFTALPLYYRSWS